MKRATAVFSRRRSYTINRGDMNFYLYVALVLSLAVLSTAQELYNGYEQANYTIVESNVMYELRRYPASTWVATPTDGAVYDDIGTAAFSRLNAYINGANVENRRIKMAVPVITNIASRTCAFCNTTFTMHFYMPSEMAETEVPTPQHSLLDIDNMPEMEVYTRRFGGFADGDDWRREASRLHDDLNANGVTDNELRLDSFFAAGYDSPWKILNRRNEVWIVKA